jgi:hypothetical protein
MLSAVEAFLDFFSEKLVKPRCSPLALSMVQAIADGRQTIKAKWSVGSNPTRT